MATFALTGNDSIILKDIPLNDFADGDIGTLEIPNNIFAMQTGKDGNTIFALDESGNNANLTVRLMMSSPDDKRLNGLIPKSSSFAETILLTGAVIKQVGDGTGKVSYNTYTLSGGLISKKPNIKTNVNGDASQAVVEYSIMFANGNRSIL